MYCIYYGLVSAWSGIVLVATLYSLHQIHQYGLCLAMIDIHTSITQDMACISISSITTVACSGIHVYSSISQAMACTSSTSLHQHHLGNGMYSIYTSLPVQHHLGNGMYFTTIDQFQLLTVYGLCIVAIYLLYLSQQLVGLQYGNVLNFTCPSNQWIFISDCYVPYSIYLVCLEHQSSITMSTSIASSRTSVHHYSSSSMTSCASAE